MSPKLLLTFLSSQ